MQRLNTALKSLSISVSIVIHRYHKRKDNRFPYEMAAESIQLQQQFPFQMAAAYDLLRAASPKETAKPCIASVF